MQVNVNEIIHMMTLPFSSSKTSPNTYNQGEKSSILRTTINLYTGVIKTLNLPRRVTVLIPKLGHNTIYVALLPKMVA